MTLIYLKIKNFPISEFSLFSYKLSNVCSPIFIFCYKLERKNTSKNSFLSSSFTVDLDQFEDAIYMYLQYVVHVHSFHIVFTNVTLDGAFRSLEHISLVYNLYVFSVFLLGLS